MFRRSNLRPMPSKDSGKASAKTGESKRIGRVTPYQGGGVQRRRPAIVIAATLLTALGALKMTGVAPSVSLPTLSGGGSFELVVRSSPPGSVYSDGQRVGVTGRPVKLRAGKHGIEVRSSGYIPATFKLDGKDDRQVNRRVYLSPIRYRVMPVNPPLPGTTISSVRLLSSGGVGLTASDSRGLMTAWQLTPDGRMNKLPVETRPTSYEVIDRTGTRIAYLEPAERGDENTEIWLSEQGNPTRRLWSANPKKERVEDISFRPDGEHLLAVVSPTGDSSTGSELLWLSLDGGEGRVLTHLPSGIVPGSWVWSPDGRMVAFLATDSFGTSLALLRTNGRVVFGGYISNSGYDPSTSLSDSRVRRLNSSSMPAANFGPDDTLLFCLPADEGFMLYMVGPRATTPRKVRHTMLDYPVRTPWGTEGIRQPESDSVWKLTPLGGKGQSTSLGVSPQSPAVIWGENAEEALVIGDTDVGAADVWYLDTPGGRNGR